MKSRTSSKFDQIRQTTAVLAVIERLENPHRLIMGEMSWSLYSLHVYWLFFILAGNKNMHKSLEEFEFQPDSANDYGVSCP